MTTPIVAEVNNNEPTKTRAAAVKTGKKSVIDFSRKYSGVVYYDQYSSLRL